ncbi:MAG: nuclear transport factor 2 family protein, partial [Salinimicrobium sp.]
FWFTASVSAQESLDKKEIQKTIETFFEGFHARDSVMMKSVLREGVVVQTIGRNQEGELMLQQEELHKVLKGIVSIPLETTFKETLHSYEIKIDGAMANVWTPYSFRLNGVFSHCGVNNFQLLKDYGSWKIIYIIDTRRREGCDEKEMK